MLILARCKKPEAASSGGFAGLFRKPLLWILIFAMISYLVMESGLAFFANSFFIWEYSSAILGAWSISVFWCAHTVSRLVFALVPVKSRRVVLMGFSVSVLFLVLLMIARNQWVSLTLFGILGFIMGPVWPMIVGMGAKNFPERSGTAVGFLTASGGLGGIFTPPLIGLISEYQGIHAGFAVLGLFAAAAFFALRFWGKENA
jgi:fucose permease